MSVTGNVVYNWERGQWHPWATGGVGVYRLRYSENDFSASDTKLGLNLGGGVDYFLSRRDAVTGEIALHALPGDADTSGLRARYWTIAGGYKLFF
jgi:opacity protein-like surface antigen